MFRANLQVSKLLSFNFAALCLMVCLYGVSAVTAQTFRGKISGTVSDQTGAVVPGAKVVAKNLGTGIERVTTTDAEGAYTIPEIPIGNYEIRAEQSGFQIGT